MKFIEMLFSFKYPHIPILLKKKLLYNIIFVMFSHLKE